MSSSKTDFEYPLKDVNLLKVSLQQLSEIEGKGTFKAGLAGVGVYGLCTYRRLLSPGFRMIGSLSASVLLYNLYTHEARLNYARLAEICNKNASLKLNVMMK